MTRPQIETIQLKRDFFKKGLENELVSAWQLILNYVGEYESGTFDRVIFSTWYDDEENPRILLGNPEDPLGTDSSLVVHVDFSMTINGYLDSVGESFDDTDTKISLWFSNAIRKSWNQPKVKKLRQTNIARTGRFTVLTTPSESQRRLGNTNWIGGTRLRVEVDLPTALRQFAKGKAWHVFRMFFVRKGKIVEIDFTGYENLDEYFFTEIGSDFVREVGTFSEALKAHHKPKKMFLRKGCKVKQADLKKLCKLIGISKPTYLSDAQCERRKRELKVKYLNNEMEWLTDIKSLYC